MAVNADKIIVGPCRIFVGVTAPTSGLPPTYITHTAGVPASGTDVGSTEGDTVFTYQAVKEEISIEQSLAPVDVFCSGEMASLSFTVQEHTYATLQRAFDNIGTESVSGGDAFYFGGGTSILTPRKEVVMVTAMQRNATTKFVVAVLYRGYSKDGMKVSFGKKTKGVYPVTIVGLADMTRTDGDRVGYYRFEK